MFIGHQKNWEILLKEAKAERLPNAYLFYGVPGIGKKEVALAWASSLFGLKLPHPDLYVIAPEKTSISIDTLRDLRASLGRKAFRAPLRVAIIDDAHTMTLAAANSILKILEEPPRDLLFILVTSSLFRILPTIRSRCRKLFFSLSESEEALLSQTRQATDAGLEKAFGVWKNFFVPVGTRKSFQAITKTIQEWMEEEVDLAQLLELAKREKLEEAKKGELNLLDQVDLISNAQRDIERNVNKTLVMENLLMTL